MLLPWMHLSECRSASGRVPWTASFVRHMPRHTKPRGACRRLMSCNLETRLWTLAYTSLGTLHVSKWYSSDPKQAMELLRQQGYPELCIHRGHLIRQKLCLTTPDKGFFTERIRHQNPLPRRRRAINTILGFMTSTVDIFTRLGEILLHHSADFDLDGPRVHVRLTESSAAFRKTLGKTFKFKTVEPGRVWTDGNWYLKVPAEADEVTATKAVSETGPVDLAAEMLVTIGPHKGKVLIATRAAGEPAGSTLQDLDVHQKTLILAQLQQIHKAGWHHHDLHPANIVWQDGQPSIIDFGCAQQASECIEMRRGCLDDDAVAAMSISPSSSTDTAVVEETPSETTATGSFQNLEK
ncbi:hypothetical protein DFH07DRAFT_97730 [Mycena maculata]|uniref:Aminoglycoside phosphotransferase domain-containing protein n=1 Tax=Mycena maculata TaxID=230809 RepID=A0AAD7MXE6_9AGAR|nr:hypothetical protein DFH07DRAFT_97730 [Mycena maculata]